MTNLDHVVEVETVDLGNFVVREISGEKRERSQEKGVTTVWLCTYRVLDIDVPMKAFRRMFVILHSLKSL